MKEFEEPKTLQKKIERNNEVNMEFLGDLTNLFGAHESKSGGAGKYVDEIGGLGGVRLETVEPGVPAGGICTGISDDYGAETGGLPPNDLQDFVYKLCKEKAGRSDKRGLVRRMLSPDALTAVALLVEELATEMMVSWKRRIDSPRTASPPAAATSTPTPTAGVPVTVAMDDITAAALAAAAASIAAARAATAARVASQSVALVAAATAASGGT